MEPKQNDDHTTRFSQNITNLEKEHTQGRKRQPQGDEHKAKPQYKRQSVQKCPRLFYCQ